MIKNPPTKQEGNPSDDHKAPTTSSRLWPGLKNPRIVRVSRAFGGKDRHSKVSTIRGLRDRRVRLSVSTAIQLYDLQDRLGLNQPSKVVDWLLNAAKHEIDKLPPLQLPPENFIQFPQSPAVSHEVTPSQAPSHPPTVENSQYMNENGPRPLLPLSKKARIEDPPTYPASKFWNQDASQRFQQREGPKVSSTEKGGIVKGNEVMDAQVMSHDPLPRPGHSLISGLLSNAMSYASYYHWEASNAYLSQLGNQHQSSQLEAPPMLIPSSRSLAPESQVVLCPSGVMSSMFQSYMANPNDFDAKQFSHLQMVSSASQNLPSDSARSSLQSDGPELRPFQ